VVLRVARVGADFPGTEGALALGGKQKVRPAKKCYNTLIIKRLRSATAKTVHKKQEAEGL